ncbi:MAG: hypothetical protein ACLQVI_29890 [Polyangiaceae bacterium]
MSVSELVCGAAVCAALSACTASPAANGASPPAANDTSPVSVTLPCRDVGDPSDQRRGSTCLCCHSDEFGVAGSVDPAAPPVAHVIVVDVTGDVADVSPNSFANFFRHFPMTPPLQASVVGPDGGTLPMQEEAPSADCNGCHFSGGPAAPIYGP